MITHVTKGERDVQKHVITKPEIHFFAGRHIAAETGLGIDKDDTDDQ